MRIGLPLFGDEISPRFCFATTMLVVDEKDGRELSRKTVSLGPPWFPGRLAQLEELGVCVLLCGGFNRAFRPQAERMGLLVICGLCGRAEEVLTTFLRSRSTLGKEGFMKGTRIVAIASEDNLALEGQVSAHFGRCPWYTLVEVTDGTVVTTKAVANPHYDAHQPGVMPAFIHGLGANVIIAGGMGPRAVDLFQAFGIEVATGAVGNAGNVLQAYLDGRLQGIVPCSHDHPDSCGGH